MKKHRGKLIILLGMILGSSLAGCKSGQEPILIEEPETRIYEKFDEETDEFFVGDTQNLDTERIKAFYYNQLDFVIPEEDLRKSVQIQSNADMIISFDPVVDSVSLNNSYIIIVRDNYIKAVSSNPSKFIIPESFDLEQIISLEEQESLNNKVLKQMSRKGKAKISFTDLYFDTQRLGKLIYTIKVEVDTSDYVFAELFVYDGFTGDLID